MVKSRFVFVGIIAEIAFVGTIVYVGIVLFDGEIAFLCLLVVL